MAPPSLWSGNLRLSLVLIPVRLVPAVSTAVAISFQQIHESSGKPVKYVKGVRDGDTFTEAQPGGMITSRGKRDVTPRPN
jgi:non-homologous end joining protein Ku